MPAHDMDRRDYHPRVMTGNEAHPRRAVTPPKGRPTRARRGRFGEARVFTSTFQWATAIGVVLVAFVVLVLVTS